MPDWTMVPRNTKQDSFCQRSRFHHVYNRRFTIAQQRVSGAAVPASYCLHTMALMKPDVSKPSWRLRLEDRSDYLYAQVSGPADSPAITLAYWRQIEIECKNRAARWLLVCDQLLGEPASPEDFGKLAQALSDGPLVGMRIAFHEPVAEHLRFVEHGEIAMREAGLTLRVFGSEREAELWLRYGQT